MAKCQKKDEGNGRVGAATDKSQIPLNIMLGIQFIVRRCFGNGLIAKPYTLLTDERV